jgi:hypothetical protein
MGMEVSPVGISTAGTSDQGPLAMATSCAVVLSGGGVAQPTTSRRHASACFMERTYLSSSSGEEPAASYEASKWQRWWSAPSLQGPSGLAGVGPGAPGAGEMDGGDAGEGGTGGGDGASGMGGGD